MVFLTNYGFFLIMNYFAETSMIPVGINNSRVIKYFYIPDSSRCVLSISMFLGYSQLAGSAVIIRCQFGIERTSLLRLNLNCPWGQGIRIWYCPGPVVREHTGTNLSKSACLV